jgi:hypothetical protein
MHYKLGQQSKTEALNDFMAAFENAATTFPVVRRVAAVMTGFAPHLRQELTVKATEWWNRPRPLIRPTPAPAAGFPAQSDSAPTETGARAPQGGGITPPEASVPAPATAAQGSGHDDWTSVEGDS